MMHFMALYDIHTFKIAMHCTTNYYKSLHHMRASHCVMCSGVRLRCRHAATNAFKGQNIAFKSRSVQQDCTARNLLNGEMCSKPACFKCQVTSQTRDHKCSQGPPQCNMSHSGRLNTLEPAYLIVFSFYILRPETFMCTQKCINSRQTLLCNKIYILLKITHYV